MVSTFPVPTESILKLSVAQYHGMIRAGILTEDDPVELINGYVIEKMPKNPRHRAATKLLRTVLEQLICEGYYVDSQEPITLSDSEPELDVMIIRGDTRDYLDHHPQAQDVALIVEVSDSTLSRDRPLKKSLYAHHGIPHYWILNLVDKQLEIFSQPEPKTATYAVEQILQPEDKLQLSLTPNMPIAFPVKQVFP